MSEIFQTNVLNMVLEVWNWTLMFIICPQVVIEINLHKRRVQLLIFLNAAICNLYLYYPTYDWQMYPFTIIKSNEIIVSHLSCVIFGFPLTQHLHVYLKVGTFSPISWAMKMYIKVYSIIYRIFKHFIFRNCNLLAMCLTPYEHFNFKRDFSIKWITWSIA